MADGDTGLRKIYLLSPHVTPKYPSRHIQMKASTLTSMQLPPFSQGELVHASQGTEEIQKVT